MQGVALGPHASNVLRENSLHRWNIEFGGFLTNHLWHGIVALSALGASGEVVGAFVAEYTQKLQPASLAADGTDNVVVLTLGCRQHFQAFVAAFEQQLLLLATNTSSAAARAFWAAPPSPRPSRTLITAAAGDRAAAGTLTCLPQLLDGLAGAAFHAFIHLGIGLRLLRATTIESILSLPAQTSLLGPPTEPEAEQQRHEQQSVAYTMVVEGLAYLSHSWLPVGGGTEMFDAAFQLSTPPSPSSLSSSGSPAGPSQSWRTVLDNLRTGGELGKLLVAEWPRVVELQTGYFQKCMHCFAHSAPAAPSVSTAPAAALLRYARTIDEALCALPATGYAARLLSLALEVFVCVRDCDYFLLHGVTAAFSLLPLLPLLSAEAALRACRRLLCGLLAVYVAQGCPALSPSAQHANTTGTQPDTVRRKWEVLRGEAVADAARIHNEHVYKLIWFCQDLDLSPHTQSVGQALSTVEEARSGANRERPGASTNEDGWPSHWLLWAASRKALRMELTGRSGEGPIEQQRAAL